MIAGHRFIPPMLAVLFSVAHWSDVVCTYFTSDAAQTDAVSFRNAIYVFRDNGGSFKPTRSESVNLVGEHLVRCRLQLWPPGGAVCQIILLSCSILMVYHQLTTLTSLYFSLMKSINIDGGVGVGFHFPERVGCRVSLEKDCPSSFCNNPASLDLLKTNDLYVGFKKRLDGLEFLNKCVWGPQSPAEVVQPGSLVLSLKSSNVPIGREKFQLQFHFMKKQDVYRINV